MTVLELIKNGVLKNDISMVAEGYQMMTGEQLLEKSVKSQPQTNKPVTPPKIVDEFDIENFIVGKDPKQQQPRVRIAEDGREEREARREPINLQKVKEVGSLFIDDNTVAVEDKGLTERQKVIPPVARTRPAAKLRAVECTGPCKRTYNVNPALIPTGGYKCPNCIRRMAGR